MTSLSRRDGASASRHRGHDEGQLAPVLAQLVEPLRCGSVGQLDVIVVVEQQQSGLAVARPRRGIEGAPKARALERLRERAGEGGEQVHFARGEVRAAELAMHHDHAPGVRPAHACDTQLVAEPARAQQLPVTTAAVEVPAGRLAQAAGQAARGCEFAHLVHVGLVQLDLHQAHALAAGDGVLDPLADRYRRRRVARHHRHAVERDGAGQGARRARGELVRSQTGVCEPDDLAAQLV